jgi:hypothetical protein
MNGCWTIDGEYVGWGRNIFIHTDKTLYCFCDERDGCNEASDIKTSFIKLFTFVLLFSFFNSFF